MAKKFVLLMDDATFYDTAKDAFVALHEASVNHGVYTGRVRVHEVDSLPEDAPGPKDYITVYEQTGDVYDGRRRTLADANAQVDYVREQFHIAIMTMRLVPANDTP